MPDNQKEKWLFAINALLELVQQDKIDMDSVKGLTVDEVLARAAKEADAVVDEGQKLKDKPDNKEQ